MKKLICFVIVAILCITCFSLVGCTTVSEEHYASVQKELTNPNASPNAKKLYEFLLSNYGKKVITGQYVNEYEKYEKDKFLDENGNKTVFKANEVQAVHSVTGKYPAMLGFDLSQALDENLTNFSIEQAIEFHTAGGIVTFCWHWFPPVKEGEKSHFYTDQTDFDLKKLWKIRIVFIIKD